MTRQTNWDAFSLIGLEREIGTQLMVNNKSITSVLLVVPRLIQGLTVRARKLMWSSSDVSNGWFAEWTALLNGWVIEVKPVVECACNITIEFELYDHFRSKMKARAVTYLPRTHPTNWNYFRWCYYLSMAGSCGFSCSNSSRIPGSCHKSHIKVYTVKKLTHASKYHLGNLLHLEETWTDIYNNWHTPVWSQNAYIVTSHLSFLIIH